MKRILLTLTLGIILLCTSAQKRYTDTEKAKQLKSIYKDSEVVASKSYSQYLFEIDKDKLVVSQKDQTDLIALQSNIKYYKNIYYNDNIELINGSARYTSGKGILKTNKVFGNYEVGGVFYSDAKVGHYAFDMLYEATEITFRSHLKYTDPKYLTKVFFQDNEPIHKRDISFTVPQGIEIELIEKNFEGYNITRTQKQEEGNTVYHYTCEKLKELKEEKNSPGILHYAPHIIVTTKNYEVNGNRNSVISNVDDLYNWYSSLAKQVKTDPSVFSNQVKTLIANAKTDEEKIKNIYYWVQENIKYIAFEDGIAGFKPEAPQNVYNNRYGDCKGMAILTKAMLQEAGIDARLTWIGTSKIPYDYSLPSLAVDNHMICTAFVGEQDYILDATEKYVSLGKNGERIQGKEMLIEDGDSYIRKTVPVGNAEDNLILRSETISIKDDNLVGTGELTVNGETKKTILYISNNSKVEDKDELFDYLSVSEYTNEDEVNVNNKPESDRDLPLKIDYNYNIGNHISRFDDEVFIEIDWDKRMSKSKIKDERKSAYSFGRKVMSKTFKKLIIPSGYKVSHIPEAVNYQTDDILINVNFKIKGKTIIYTNEIIVGKGKIMPGNFNEWNNIVKELNALYNDQIILKKI